MRREPDETRSYRLPKNLRFTGTTLVEDARNLADAIHAGVRFNLDDSVFAKRGDPEAALENSTSPWHADRYAVNSRNLH